MSTELESTDAGDEDRPVPLCLHCLHPLDPLDKICPGCGRAAGQLTPYLPWESIRWQAGIWGQMWKQVWRGDVPLIGRFFRMAVIAFFVPVMLVGLIPMAWRRFHGRTF
jgi:hypothetical protein